MEYLQERTHFCIPSLWMQKPHLYGSSWINKPLSSMMKRGCFCRGQTVCRGTPLLYPNTCCWGFGQIQSGMLAPSTWHQVFIVSLDFNTSCFLICTNSPWNGRDLYWFGILNKGSFLEDGCGFEVLVVCHGFCWVTMSNHLWNAQRKGDSYS